MVHLSSKPPSDLPPNPLPDGRGSRSRFIYRWSVPDIPAPLILEDKVIIEIKALDALAQVHYKQVRTYLKLSGLKLGLLINFGEILMKDGIHRIANNMTS